MSTSEHDGSGAQSEAQDLFLRYVKKARSGGTQAFQALCEEHPEQADYLRELHSIYKLGAALASSQSFHESLRQRYGDINEITLSVDEDSSVDATVATQVDEGFRQRTYDTSRYRLEGEIARGGMGIVFRVKDQDLSRSIAMKVMHPGLEGESPQQSDSLALARFLEEAQVMAQLDHPGIVPVHEVGFDSDGQIYFTMKLVKGKNFNEICVLARESKDDWNTSRALSVLVRVCQSVAFAHSKGVVHRDLKPSNIMVGRFGEAYVMDWGLAKVRGWKDLHDIRVQPDHEATQTSIQSFRKAVDSDQEFALVTLDGSVLGTPAYMPPEQASGRVDEVDERSDVYSLGAVLYKLLTGTAPYLKEGARLSPHTILGLVVQGPPTVVEKLNPSVSAELAAICKKAMSRDRADRYQSCRHLAEDLQAYLDRRVVRAHRTGALAELRSWVFRNRVAAASAFAVIVLVVLSAAVIANKARRLEEELYASDMAAAQRALEMNDVSEVRRIVERHSRLPADKKRFEFRYLKNVLARVDRAQTMRIPYPAWSLDLSSDGRTIAVGMSYDAVAVLDANTGEVKASFGEGDQRFTFTSTVISPDGDSVAFARQNNVIVKRLGGLPESDGRVFEGHTGTVTQLARSRDGTMIASVSNDGEIRTWSMETGESVEVFRNHDIRFYSVAISPDGTMLAAGNRAGEVILCDLNLNQVVRTLELHDERVATVAFSPDGRTIASGSRDGVLLLFDVETGKPITRRMTHDDGIMCVRFSPDGKHLASSSRAGDVKIWSSNGVEMKSLKPHITGVPAIEFTDNGRKLVTASDERISIVDIGTEMMSDRLVADTRWWIDSIALSPDCQRLFYMARRSSQVYAWNIDRGEYEESIEVNGHAQAIATSSQNTLAVADDNGIHFWDTASRQKVPQVIQHAGTVQSLAFAPSGRLLAGGCDDGVIRIWDVDSGVVKVLRCHTKPIQTVRFSRDGTLLAAGSDDRTASVWRVRDGKRLHHLEGHRATVMSVDISPDNSTLATGGWGHEIRLWSISSGDGNLLGRHFLQVKAVRFSADGRDLYAASGDHRIHIWDIRQRRVRFSLNHGDLIVAMVVSPDDDLLISSGGDNAIRFWRTNTPGDRADQKRSQSPLQY